MSLQHRLDMLKKIEQLATLAGLQGKVDEERMAYVFGFELDQGRSQVVFVRYAGELRNKRDETGSSQPIVTFYSPCLVRKKGFLSGLSKEQAFDLLRRNETFALARYSISESEKESAVVASYDQFLEMLGPSEFAASALHVAVAADLYEREHNQDTF